MILIRVSVAQDLFSTIEHLALYWDPGMVSLHIQQRKRPPMCIAVSAFMLLTIFTGVAHADYLDYYFKLRCDSANNRAEIVTYAISNANFYSAEPQDCVLSNGRTIRAKMGLGPVYPYGMGGSDPSKWLSVWVDRSHVLSRTHFDCYEGDAPCNLRVIVTAKGLKVCERKQQGSVISRNTSRQSNELCDFTPNRKLSKSRDSLEFPLPNERVRPPAGSLTALYSKDNQFCRQFQLQSRPHGRPGDNIWPGVGLPNDAEAIEPDTPQPYESSESYQRYVFDINNDGTVETIVGLHWRSHMHDGDIYFVYADSKIPSPISESDSSAFSEQVHAKAAKRIIPHYWSDYNDRNEKQLADEGDGAYAVKSVSAPWWDEGNTPIFRFRYWYLWPFRHNQQTYFLTWSQEADKRHWYTVLRPDTDYHVTEMCVFQIVPVRY